MNLFDKWSAGLSYANFLGKYASPSDNARWQFKLNQTVLTPEQHRLLKGFKRKMPVLCLAAGERRPWESRPRAMADEPSCRFYPRRRAAATGDRPRRRIPLLAIRAFLTPRGSLASPGVVRGW